MAVAAYIADPLFLLLFRVGELTRRADGARRITPKLKLEVFSAIPNEDRGYPFREQRCSGGIQEQRSSSRALEVRFERHQEPRRLPARHHAVIEGERER